MTMRQIVPQEWRPFLESLGRERRAWLATLELDGVTQARDEPLIEISASERIEVRVGSQAICLAEPRAVQVEETDGAPQAVEIDDASGRHLSLRFRVAAASGALDGVAPAEIQRPKG
jgi:hypothetical protein